MRIPPASGAPRLKAALRRLRYTLGVETVERARERRMLVVGNSDGIGLAFTKRLLEEGWIVTGVSRSPSPLSDPRYEHAVLDVAAPAYGETLAELVARRGPFETCVYCAGVGELFDARELARDAMVVRVNFVGAMDTAAVVLPSMIATKRGHFVALSSIGDGTSPEAPSYAASKAGLSSWLSGLSLALRPHGVHVTNVRLGFVDTKMAKSKVRPMMVPVGRAVDVLFECLARRPARRTFPRLMQPLMTVLGWLVALKVWWT
jgi:NAD(P)-dependent dehydrogenase (short-subunit alcohol dehydrogenase family)